MLKENAFINKQYRRLLLGFSITVIALFAGEMVDVVIAGNFIGTSAFTAVNQATDITFFTDGIALMLGIGFQILHARELGRYNRKKASEYFMQAMIASAIFGIILAVLTGIVSNRFVMLSNLKGQSLIYEKEYLTFAPALAAICCSSILSFLTLNDGDYKVTIIASLSNCLVNIISSCLLLSVMGISGLCVGTVIGKLVSILVVSLHFFGKSNSIIRTEFCFDYKKILEIIYYGLYGFVNYMITFVVNIILDHYIVSKFGSNYAIPYAIVSGFLECVYLLEIVPQMGVTFTSIYIGEKNRMGVYNTLKECVKYELILGLIITFIFIVGSSLIPGIYGIEAGKIYSISEYVSIMMGISALSMGFMYLFMHMYACLDHPLSSLLFVVLFTGFFPLTLSIALGSYFGFYGFIVGIALVPLFTIVTGLVVMRLVHGKKDFPFYQPELFDGSIYCMNSYSPQSRRILITMEEDLVNDGLSLAKAKEIHHYMNELTLNLFDLNENKNITLELSVRVEGQNVYFHLRDNGIWLTSSLVNQLFDGMNVEYMITTSVNRYSFMIK